MATRERNENVVLILELDCGDCSRKEIFYQECHPKVKCKLKNPLSLV